MRKKKKNSNLILISLLAGAAVVVAVGIYIFVSRDDVGGDPVAKDDWWKVYPAVSEQQCKDWNGTLIEAKKDLHCGDGMIPGAQVETAAGEMKVCCMYVDANFNKAFQSPVEEAQLNVRSVLGEKLQKQVEIEVKQQNDDHMFGDFTSLGEKDSGKFYAVKTGMQWEISAAGKSSIGCALGEQHGYPKEWIQDCTK